MARALAILWAGVLLFGAKNPAEAQDILPVLTPDGEAYIYHNHLPSIGEGVNVYRIHNGEEVRLNEEPLYPADNGAEFRQQIGDHYRRLAEDLEAESPQEVYLRLRGNENMAFLSGFSFPEIALALGILYVDENPVTGEEVAYRIELVDRRGEPTGDELEEETVVEEVPVPEPRQPEADREGSEVTVSWHFPEATEENDDNVIRFEVYMRPDGKEYFRKVTERSVTRQSGITDYDHSFEPEEIPQSAEFMIEAIDFTGANTATAGPESFELIDTRQPEPVLEVYSSLTEDEVIEITWAVSTEPFVEGYHVDRVNHDTEEHQRMTDELIDVSDPQFRDATAEPGYDYYYYIYAVSDTGVESEEGNPAIEYISDRIPPPAPEKVTAEIMEEQTVEVTWDEKERNDGFNTYIILRRVIDEEGERAYSQINDGRVTSGPVVDDGVAETGFTEGLYYEYGVAAANNQGLRSDTVFTSLQIPNITPPEPPVSFNAENDGGHRVNLRWGASPSTDVVSYNKYKITPQADTALTTLSRGQRFTVDSEVNTGEEYRYFVTAVDSAGNESEPAEPIDMLVRDTTPPAPARNLQAVDLTEENGVRLRWQPSSSDDVQGYIVQRSEISNGQFERINEEPLEDVDWIDEEGEAGKWYRVYAVDESGNESNPSSPRQATSRD